MKVAPMLAILALAPGCAFLSKNEPLQPRYFTVEAGPSAPAAPAARSDLKLRLGPVVAGGDIRQYLMVRTGDRELGYSSDLRWTERPESYLRRALSRAIFEERGLQRVISGSAPMLEVELTAFEEIRQPSARVRVAAVVTLHDGRVVLLERTFHNERPLLEAKGVEHPRAVARELGAALGAMVEEIAGEVVKRR